MIGAGEAVGLTAMVLGVALLMATALVDLPGLRQRNASAVAVGACYVAAFAAIVGGASLLGRCA